MEPAGLFFLRPIVNLLTGKYSLGLTRDEVVVYYTTYINEFKHTLKDGQHSITEAVELGLTPVGSVQYKFDTTHAMVLDTIESGPDEKNFVFKNTYAAESKIKIAVDDANAPDEFFFVHIEANIQ